jgi:ribosomal protein S18 acetylase RimI-like enzyme
LEGDDYPVARVQFFFFLIMESIAIRDYHPNDYDVLVSLWEKLGLGGKHRDDSPEVIKHTLDFGGKLLLMEISGSQELIGSSWITQDGRRSYIHHFGIKKDWQGKGLSKPLMEATLAFARQLRLQVKLEVGRSNLIASSLYRKYGFTPLGQYDVYILRDILPSV